MTLEGLSMVNDDGCLVRGGQNKTAGAHVYLMEELGDARMRCDQLVRYIGEASKLIENSSHRDHFFEVAGHLIQAIPQTLFRLQKALQAVALAATRIDYEEIKQELRPEKVEQLERVLQDVRIRQVRHRSQPWTPEQAVGQLRALAGKVNETGWLDRGDLINLILGLEVGSKTASDVGAAHILETLADSVENSEEVSRLRLAALLRRILADEILSIGGEPANDEPRNPMERAAQEWKVEAANLFDQIRPGDTVTITTPQGQQVRGKAVMRGPHGWVLNLGGRHGRPGIASPENVVKVTKGRRTGSEDDDKESRFEEGKPADPTKNMSPEEAKKWREMNEKYDDKFKKDAAWKEGMNVAEEHKQSRRPDRKKLQVGDKVFYNGRPATIVKTGLPSAMGDRGSVELEVDGVSGRIKTDPGLDHNLTMYKGERVPSLSDLLWKRDAGDDDKESRFEEGKPADPTKDMSPEDAKKWREMNEKYDDKFKKDAAVNAGRLKKFVHIIEDVLPSMKSALAKYEKDPAKYAPQLDNLATDANSIGVAVRGLQRALGKTASEDEDKESRFEEGKPADPTKNMSPEEAKKWREMNEKYDDKFKKDATWKVDAAARFGRGVSADELAKQMNSAADVIYKARGQTRKVGELLQECLEGQPFGEGPLAGADDAVLRRTREVKKSLYDWDFQGGQAASGLEGLAIKVKKIPPYQRLASEDPWKVEAKDLPTELETGAKLKVLVRRGDWPPDMYRKGELAEVKKGGKVGDDIVVKMKNDAMSSGQHFKLQVNKDGTYKLVGDPKFRRELKVQKL